MHPLLNFYDCEATGGSIYDTLITAKLVSVPNTANIAHAYKTSVLCPLHHAGLSKFLRQMWHHCTNVTLRYINFASTKFSNFVY